MSFAKVVSFPTTTFSPPFVVTIVKYEVPASLKSIAVAELSKSVTELACALRSIVPP